MRPFTEVLKYTTLKMLQTALLELKSIKKIERINIEKQMEINYVYDLY